MVPACRRLPSGAATPLALHTVTERDFNRNPIAVKGPGICHSLDVKPKTLWLRDPPCGISAGACRVGLEQNRLKCPQRASSIGQIARFNEYRILNLPVGLRPFLSDGRSRDLIEDFDIGKAEPRFRCSAFWGRATNGPIEQLLSESPKAPELEVGDASVSCAPVERSCSGEVLDVQ